MRAEAVAEAGGKIIAVGTKADVMKVKGPQTQVIDLKGRSRQDAADYRFRL
jgi:predicted amidohydrolase YtcJ